MYIPETNTYYHWSSSRVIWRISNIPKAIAYNPKTIMYIPKTIACISKAITHLPKTTIYILAGGTSMETVSSVLLLAIPEMDNPPIR